MGCLQGNYSNCEGVLEYTMTLRERQAKFAEMLGKLLFKALLLGTPVVILELYRSPELQRVYVARGVSKTLNSKHLEGLAVDLAFLKDIQDDGKINYMCEKWRILGGYWESIGGSWGGRFGDNPLTEIIEGWDCGHFEYKHHIET